MQQKNRLYLSSHKTRKLQDIIEVTAMKEEPVYMAVFAVTIAIKPICQTLLRQA